MASGDEAPDVAEGRHEVEVLGDHQDPARGAGGADHPVDLGQRGRERLLDEDVQARLECRERVAQVPVVRRAHERARGARVADGVLVRAEGVHGGELAREGAGPPGVAARREQRDPEATRRPCMAARDPATSEQDERSRSHEF